MNMNTRADRLRAWIKTARPGARYEYFRGHLAFMREWDGELDEAAKVAMWAERRGDVLLLQKRVTPAMTELQKVDKEADKELGAFSQERMNAGQFSYLAQKRRR